MIEASMWTERVNLIWALCLAAKLHLSDSRRYAAWESCPCRQLLRNAFGTGGVDGNFRWRHFQRLELYAEKFARRVLRGAGISNGSRLPDKSRFAIALEAAKELLRWLTTSTHDSLAASF